MKEKLAALIFLGATTLTIDAYAECRPLNDAEKQEILKNENNQFFGYPPAPPGQAFKVLFSASEIEVSPDLEINQPIAIGESMATTGFYFLSCLEPGTIFFDVDSKWNSLGNNVFSTNISGVGFRIKYQRGSGTSSYLPFSSKHTNPPSGVRNYVSINPGAKFLVELIKTGPMESRSTITLPAVATISGDSLSPLVFVQAGSVSLLVKPSCTVEGSNPKRVDFGSFGPRDVTTSNGPTRPLNFSLRCSGPTPVAMITASLTGAPDTDQPTLLGNAGSATKLAIRLRDAQSKQLISPNDANSTLTLEPKGNTAPQFNLEATVLRVGSESPTAGNIRANATFTLSIQ